MMTSNLVRLAAIAAIAIAPLAAQAGDRDDLRACAKAYAAESFSDRETSIRVDQNFAPRLPLIAHAHVSDKVSLTATGKQSRRVLGTATCSARQGTVTVKPIG